MAEATPGRILIVDDEPDMVSGIAALLRRQKFEVETASSGLVALEKLAAAPVQLVLTDLTMPGMSGLDLLEQIKSRYPDTLVVLVTGFATVQTAVEAIRKGAFDYVPKPFSPQQLEVVVRRAFEHQALTRENRDLRRQIRDRFSYDKLMGVSDSMKRVYEILRRISATEASVLIIGESGTGKELIAQAIHANSLRSSRAFQPVDCAALPANLLESELFGYEKGAFTGANTQRKGLLEAADGGTFFLDELGELDLAIQVKFLRVLQEREFRRVGGQKMISVDVRVVAATNRDLEKEVREGRFREDLYHRLNVIQIRLPPLRERHGDIMLLAQHFLTGFAARSKKGELSLAPAAQEVLEAHRWPGNVRELQNAMEYAASLCEGQWIGVDDLPLVVRESAAKLRPVSVVVPEPPPSPTPNLPLATLGPNPPPGSLGGVVHHDLPYKKAKRRWLEVFEREYILELLRRHEFNISQAANTAQIDRKSIQRIVKKNNIQLPRDN